MSNGCWRVTTPLKGPANMGYKQLWDKTELPAGNYAQYNQAIMDLGATICTRHKPACDRCPVMSSCQAYAQSRVLEFPI